MVVRCTARGAWSLTCLLAAALAIELLTPLGMRPAHAAGNVSDSSSYGIGATVMVAALPVTLGRQPAAAYPAGLPTATGAGLGVNPVASTGVLSAGGTGLTVHGENFDTSTTVTFDGVPGADIHLGADVAAALIRPLATAPDTYDVLSVVAPAHRVAPNRRSCGYTPSGNPGADQFTLRVANALNQESTRTVRITIVAAESTGGIGTGIGINGDTGDSGTGSLPDTGARYLLTMMVLGVSLVLTGTGLLAGGSRRERHAMACR
jgi:hypothetical protein